MLNIMNLQSLKIVCRYTGVVGTINLPAIPSRSSMAIEYTHPIAELGTALDLANQDRKYLMQLDKQVIAGILISILRNLSLYRSHIHVATINDALCLAGKGLLVRAIQDLAVYVAPVSAQREAKETLPKIAFDDNILELLRIKDERERNRKANILVANCNITLIEAATDSDVDHSYIEYIAASRTGWKELETVLSAIEYTKKKAKEKYDQKLQELYAEVQQAKANRKEANARRRSGTTNPYKNVVSFKTKDLYPSAEYNGKSFIEVEANDPIVDKEKMRARLIRTRQTVINILPLDVTREQKEKLKVIFSRLEQFDNEAIEKIAAKLESSSTDYGITSTYLRTIVKVTKTNILDEL